MRDGSRKVSSMAEVIRATDEGVELGEIYRYERTGLDESGRVQGRFVWTGYVPKFMERLKARGSCCLSRWERPASGASRARSNWREPRERDYLSGYDYVSHDPHLHARHGRCRRNFHLGSRTARSPGDRQSPPRSADFRRARAPVLSYASSHSACIVSKSQKRCRP